MLGCIHQPRKLRADLSSRPGGVVQCLVSCYLVELLDELRIIAKPLPIVGGRGCLVKHSGLRLRLTSGLLRRCRLLSREELRRCLVADSALETEKRTIGHERCSSWVARPTL